jgi:hypothetical protein
VTAPATADVTTVISRLPSPKVARLAAAALGRATLRHAPQRPGETAITVLVARDATDRAAGTLRRNGSQ